MQGKKLIKISIIALVLILISDFIILSLGLKFNPDFYLIHHYLGGFFVAMFFYGYLSEIMFSSNIKTHKKWIIIIGTTLFIGVLWEFLEYLGTFSQINYLSYFKIGDLADTLADLLVDALGAITLLGLLHNRFRR